MESGTANEVLEAWDAYIEDEKHYLDGDGNRVSADNRFELRRERIAVIREIIDEFQSGKLELTSFKQKIDGENKSHRLWGFAGAAQLNLNQLVNHSRDQNRLSEITEILQAAIQPPGDRNRAKLNIRNVNEFIRDLAEKIEDGRTAPFRGVTPMILSYFWHIRVPDTILPYYKSCREAYKEIGVWRPRGTPGERYVSFWKATDQCRRLIEEERGGDCRLWDFEYSMLRYNNRSQAAKSRRVDMSSPEVEEGTYGEFESQESIEQESLGIDITGLYFPTESDIQSNIETALRADDHILLIGPPGTGKTKLAKQICRSVGVNYRLSTGTADWTTFDTIGGYRPQERNQLEFTPGIFLECFQDEEGQPRNQWLIIDEINRADIDKAFGSLFSALTGDDVTLPFVHNNGNRVQILASENSSEKEIAPHRYYIPDQWRMIATMNTLDKTSLYEMSYAFMRRWAFISVPIPEVDLIDYKLVDQYVTEWSGIDAVEEYSRAIAEIWRAINKVRPIGPAIVRDVYEHVQLGDEPDYTSAVVMHVIPQLEGLRSNKLADFVSFLDETQVRREPLIAFIGDYFQIDRSRLMR